MRPSTLLVPAVLLLVLAPSVQAQVPPKPSLSISVQAYEGYLRPEVDTAYLTVSVEYACAGTESPLSSYRVELKVTHSPDYATVILNPASRQFTADPTSCQMGQTRAFDFQMSVTTTREAPAYVAELYALRARALEDQAEAASSAIETTITNDYRPEMSIEADRTFLATDAQGKGAFRVSFENMGNGPTRVESQVRHLHPDRLQGVAVPAPFVIESCVRVRELCQSEQFVHVVADEPQQNVVTFEVVFTHRFDGIDRSGVFPQDFAIAFAVQVVESREPPLPRSEAPAQSPGPAAAWLLVALLVGARWISGRI